MGALWATIGGIVAIVLGIVGIIYWWKLFLAALAATIPAILIFGGAIALFIGYTEMRDSLKSKDEGDSTCFEPDTAMEETKKEEEKMPEESGEKASSKASKKR